MILPNIDYLSATVDMFDYERATIDLILELLKKKAESKINSSESVSSKTLVTVGGEDFEILPNGSRGHAFILHNDRFELKLAQYRAKKREFYPIQFRIKSDVLWSDGVFKAYEDMKKILESIGEVKEIKVSRIDLCCHTNELQFGINEFDAFKGSFRKDMLRRDDRTVTALEYGSRTSMIYCRIYDKGLEIKQKQHKFWFYDIWAKNGLVIEDGDHCRVWNIEFELKRDFFKEMNLNTVVEALENIRTIWEHCTVDYLVLTENDATRKERSSINSHWEDIQKAYLDYNGSPLIKREKQLDFDAEKLLPNIIGYVTSYASKLGMIDIDEILEEIKEEGKFIVEGVKQSTYQKEIEKKMKLLYGVG